MHGHHHRTHTESGVLAECFVTPSAVHPCIYYCFELRKRTNSFSITPSQCDRLHRARSRISASAMRMPLLQGHLVGPSSGSMQLEINSGSSPHHTFWDTFLLP